MDDDDPFVYRGSSTLINIEGILDADDLEDFERVMTAQRQSEGLPKVSLTSEGYRDLHRHLFQDVYTWAGQDRTVDIAKSGSYFCRVDFVGAELDKRFDAIQAEDGLRGLNASQFTERAAEHLSEINAIHPFREGNGRTQRAFLTILAQQAGHHIELQRIDPKAWNDASRDSFQTADPSPVQAVIAAALVESNQSASSSAPADDRDDYKGEMTDAQRAAFDRLTRNMARGNDGRARESHLPQGSGSRGRPRSS